MAMLSLPIALSSVIGIFAPGFSRPVWQQVAYLRPADNLSRPPLYRLRYMNQPVLPPSQPVFTLSLNPVGLPGTPPQPLSTTIFTRPSVLGRLHLRPRRHPIAQDLCECPDVIGEPRRHRR